MRRRLTLATALLLVVIFVGTSVAAAPEQLTITGATPEQEAILREIAAWPAVPALARPITINICEGCPNIGGATGMTLNSFVPDVDYIGNTFLHEYGHIYDYHFLTLKDRQAIIDLHDVPYSWYGGAYMVRPAERFAATFAKIMMASEGYIVGAAFESLTPPFTDIGHLSQEMQDAIVWLYNQGITEGKTFNTYEPGEPVTRGQMALFFQRAFGNP